KPKSSVLSSNGRWIIGFALVAGAYWMLFKVFVHEIPPDGITRTHMSMIERRISNHYEALGKLPESLTDLLPGKGHDTIADGWGNEIGYRVSAGRVVLESFGRDRKPGGEGQDEDMYLVFDPSEGSWGTFSASP